MIERLIVPKKSRTHPRWEYGALGGIRTSDLQYRKLTLYPAELRARTPFELSVPSDVMCRFICALGESLYSVRQL